jgi:hypothetical protein
MAQQNAKKARLVELEEDIKTEKRGGKVVTVQFNPESLKLTFANQVQNNTPSNTGGTGAGSADQASGTQGRQFVGAGTTRLAVQLWFDAAAGGDSAGKVDDVRRLTQEVVYFITGIKSKADPSRFLPPGVRFVWGSFVFDGLVDGIEESIDYFSPEGKPLRAAISLTLSQQTILMSDFGKGGPGAGGARAAGTLPMTPAVAGSTLQGLAAAAAGIGASWQDIAAANGIENPRLLVPGQLLDLSAPSLRITF